MELYIVNFYDANECGNVEHNEVYTTHAAAEHRYDTLERKMSCYSWVSLYEAIVSFGRVKCGDLLESCTSCNGEDDYYHGDDTDF